MSVALKVTPDTASLDAAAMPSVLEALHCLRVAITVFDDTETLVFANEHFNHLFRSLPPRATLVGMCYADLIRLEISGGEIADPDIVADVEGFVAHRRTQLADGEYRPRDIHLADGRIIEIKARRMPRGGWIALWSDVTAARHVLGRLEKAIGLTADAFAFFDRKDRLVLCNAEYAAINGAKSPAALTGKSFQAMARSLADSGTVVTSEGSEAWFERRLEAHRVPAGAMTVETRSGTAYMLRDRATDDGGRVVVFTDVTEHRRVELALAEQTQALDKTRSELEQSQAETSRQATYLSDLSTKLDRASAEADTTKTTLLRTMSHELKTPLNAIIGFSDLLESLAGSATPEQVKEYAGLINQGGKNLLKLINQILDLSKISAGRYELNRRSLDAGSLLWLAKDAFAAKAEAKNIAIDADMSPIGLVVEADENAVTAMIHHLVENAVAFTQAGGTVRLLAARDGGTIKVTVEDNGPGVPEADLDRILLPFEQGGRGTADHTDGAGLGLTLVKAFSELHGGTLAIASPPGQGFSATIALPASAA